MHLEHQIFHNTSSLYAYYFMFKLTSNEFQTINLSCIYHLQPHVNITQTHHMDENVGVHLSKKLQQLITSKS